MKFKIVKLFTLLSSACVLLAGCNFDIKDFFKGEPGSPGEKG